MITSLTLKNFRCFDNHTVEFPTKALLVGKNNAGKSTCVEALRLVSIITERLGNLSWKYPPDDAGIPYAGKGVSPSLDAIDIHKDCLFHRYGEAPATISAVFSNKSRLEIYVGKELYVHAVIYDAKGKAAGSRLSALAAKIPRVSILPQIGPLVEGEERLADDTVRRFLQTNRSTLHFRNQLRLLHSEYFEAFSNLVRETWSGLAIQSLEIPQRLEKGTNLALVVRDGDFSAEVAWMGHGLQMWLQTMWFMVRNQKSDVLILDEPDVYMHADLQRKLVRMLMQDKRQFIIATHSPEMLAEVDPDSVVVLDRSQNRSRSATSSKAIQELLITVGSVHNLSLARLSMYRKILFVEGEDVSLLKRFQNALTSKSDLLIDTIPNTDIKGWSGWPAVLTFARFLRDNAHSEFEVYCALDRDYHTDAEITDRLQEAKKAKIHLHVWSAKELENFAISPNAIARLISRKKKSHISTGEVEAAIDTAITARKDETFDAFSEVIRQQVRAGADKSNAAARPIFNAKWAINSGRDVVGGKQLFSDIATWAQNTHGVSLSIPAIVREMTAGDVPQEIVDFIELVTTQA